MQQRHQGEDAEILQQLADAEVASTPPRDMWLVDARKWFRHKEIPEFVAYSLPGTRDLGYPMLCFHVAAAVGGTVTIDDVALEPGHAGSLRGRYSEFTRVTRAPLDLRLDEAEVAVHLPAVMRQDGTGTWWPVRLYLRLDGVSVSRPTRFVVPPDIYVSFAAHWEDRARWRPSRRRRRQAGTDSVATDVDLNTVARTGGADGSLG